MVSAAEPHADGHSDYREGRLLAEHLRRLSKDKAASPAVHVQIREPFASAREDALVRLVMRPVQDLARGHGAPFYMLSARDCVIICNDIDPSDVVAASALREPDPLLPVTPIRPLIRWYDLSESDDRLALIALARVYAEGETGEARATASDDAPKKALDPRILGEINTRLKSTRIVELIQRQPALIIGGGGRFAPLFEELYVSIDALQRHLAPHIDLFARPALFRYLTEILDAHVLKAMAQGSLGSEHPMSLNLNVRSICTPAFQAMLAERDRTVPLYIEVQVSDLLANPAGFQQAAKIVRDGGCQFCVDGLTPLMLSFLDIGPIAADVFKVAWDDQTVISGPQARRQAFAAHIAAIGSDRVLFCRIEAIEALQSAVEFGVKRLQGRLVDRLATAPAACGGQ